VTHTRRNFFFPEITDYVNFQLTPVSYTITPLKINNYRLKPLSVTDSKGNRIILQAFRENKMVWQTHPMSIISLSKARFDGTNEYLFLLEKHYSGLDREMNVRPYVYGMDNRGLIARWRGSGLTWPLIDAQISPADSTVLCALHRGDSFIQPDKSTKEKRVSAYRWNGFGFRGIPDSIACKWCDQLYKD
jgi:poly-gamma-glutamate synthesis protein (capsule biosynthesis protein)